MYTKTRCIVLLGSAVGTSSYCKHTTELSKTERERVKPLFLHYNVEFYFSFSVLSLKCTIRTRCLGSHNITLTHMY